jgi:regulator of protease activity HflC (stomatin/prohibitin superfamily)
MKNLVNKFRMFLVIGMVTLLAACSKVPAGNVGVKFDLYGGDKGVTGEVVGPGKYWLGWNEEMYLFPTFTQNYVWTAGQDIGSLIDESITFQDKEGTQINADVGISYAIDADKADTIFQKYRKGVDEITDVYLRNMVRDAINSETSRMDVADIYGVGKEELMQRVTDRVKSQVGALGINVEKIYWIGAMRLPQTIITAINNKIEATQKAQQRENELQTAKAQAEIERAKAQGEADALMIAAKAESEANRMKQATLTSELVQYTLAQRWDGKLPQVTGTATPLLNIK